MRTGYRLALTGVVDSFDGNFIALDNGNFTILHINYIPGIFNNRSGITGNKVLIVANTNHHGTAFFGANQVIEIVFRKNHNGIGSYT